MRCQLLQILCLLVGAVSLATPVAAQSTLAGVVRDTTGAVLPGVSVEAASPVLIEKLRSVVTDGEGRYSIVDLRPGTYNVTFSLAGFNAIKREGIEVAANVTVPISIELRVGSLEETLTVSGQTPVVDVQSAQKVQSLTRESLDTLPTNHTVAGVAQLIVGVSLASPDVGGARQLQQVYVRVHGMGTGQNTYSVDGISMTPYDGAVQPYFNDSMILEQSYQTSGASADNTTGGLNLNVVPKDGGNRFSGSSVFSAMPNAFQRDSVPASLLARGMRSISHVNKIVDWDSSQGGPLKQDRLWFFGSFRYQRVDTPIADTVSGRSTPNAFIPDPNGQQGIDDSLLVSGVTRLTWQMSPRSKLAAYIQREHKFRGHQMTAGDDPNTSAAPYNSPQFLQTQVKWTAPVSSRLFLEAGYANTNLAHTNESLFPQERFTPEWYALVGKSDRSLATRWNNHTGPDGFWYPPAFRIVGSASYITGSHSIKVGASHAWGRVTVGRGMNGDLNQVFNNGVAESVTVYNTPTYTNNSIRHDDGVYAQDSWTFKRLSLSGGIRWEYFNAAATETYSGVGRFVRARIFPEVSDVPNWKDWAPRFGAVYDLFGNARTALKVGINRFNDSVQNTVADRYNPVRSTTASLPWRDTNADGVAQDSEIDFTRLPNNFGTVRLNTPDPSLQRSYSLEYSAQIQHELLPRVSTSFGWFHRAYRDVLFNGDTLSPLTDNLAISPLDYAPLTIVNPIDGAALTIYNPSLAAFTAQANNIDRNHSNDSGLYQQKYDGFEFSTNARLGNKAMLVGGFSTERSLIVNCDNVDDPNQPTTIAGVITSQLGSCDPRQTGGVPYRTQLKLSGSYSLPFNLQASAAFQHNPGATFRTTYVITRALVPTLTPTTQTIALRPQGTEFLPDINQLDLSLIRKFTFGRANLQARLDVYNALDAITVISQRSTQFGAATYLQPADALQPRMFRITVQTRW
jgi:hypothetical protein